MLFCQINHIARHHHWEFPDEMEMSVQILTDKGKKMEDRNVMLLIAIKELQQNASTDKSQ
jgi:hypothetical protein